MDNAIYQNQLKTLLRIRKIYLTEVDAKRADRAASGTKFDY